MPYTCACCCTHAAAAAATAAQFGYRPHKQLLLGGSGRSVVLCYELEVARVAVAAAEDEAESESEPAAAPAEEEEKKLPLEERAADVARWKAAPDDEE